MSYDVVVTETVGECSVETKFKNYKDYLDWYTNTKSQEDEDLVGTKESESRVYLHKIT